MNSLGHPGARALLLALPVFSLVLAGCRSGTEAGAEAPTDAGPRSGGTVVVAVGADIAGLNPLTSSSQFTREIHNQLFLRLFAEQTDYAEHPPSFEPELAESSEFSDDGTELTIRLRRDVQWSDGVPVTSADVVWTLQARTDPDVAWNYAHSQERITAVEAVDDYTVVIRFEGAYTDRVANVNESEILPKHVWGQVPFAEWRQRDDWFRSHMVTSGPFRLADWRPDQELVLERNPTYFKEGLPRADRVVYRVVPERNNRLELLLSGQVDFVRGLRPSAGRRVEESGTADIVSFWHRQIVFIVWNGCRPPFDDPAVRRAMTLAIDRDEMRQAVYGDYAKIAVSPILSSLWAFNQEIEALPYDPDEARRILAERGWQDSDGDGVLDRDGGPLAFKLSTNFDNRMRVDMATITQDHLKRIGVDAELDLMEFNALIDSNEQKDFDASIASWVIDTSLDLNYAFHSDEIDTGQNYGCYHDPEADRLMDLAREQLEPAEKGRYLGEVQEILHRDQPYTFFFELKRVNGVSRRLRDARPNSLYTYDNLEEWWLAAPAG